MNGTIDIENYDGTISTLSWQGIAETHTASAITTALRELADRMAVEGAIIMGNSNDGPDSGYRTEQRIYGLGWGAMLCGAWLHDALSAIERGEDPREIG